MKIIKFAIPYQDGLNLLISLNKIENKWKKFMHHLFNDYEDLQKISTTKKHNFKSIDDNGRQHEFLNFELISSISLMYKKEKEDFRHWSIKYIRTWINIHDWVEIFNKNHSLKSSYNNLTKNGVNVLKVIEHVEVILKLRNTLAHPTNKNHFVCKELSFMNSTLFKKQIKNKDNNSFQTVANLQKKVNQILDSLQIINKEMETK